MRFAIWQQGECGWSFSQGLAYVWGKAKSWSWVPLSWLWGHDAMWDRPVTAHRTQMLRTNFLIYRGPGHQLIRVDVAPLTSTEFCGFMSWEFSFKSCYILKSKTGDGKKSNRWVVGPQTKLSRVDETQSKESYASKPRKRESFCQRQPEDSWFRENAVPEGSSNLCV